MSSATPVDVSKSRQLVNSGALDGEYSGPTNLQTPRQKQLEYYWRYYRCTNYDGRRVDWSGNEQLGTEMHEMVATSGVIPAGFYDAGQTLPIKFRKPTAPYYLGKAIVNRFTSLLFSSRRHPKIVCDDPATEDWLVGFADATRLWARMIQARTFGGAMGSVGIGFKFVAGRPIVEVHDPRYSTPTFSDKELQIVGKFEKRYQYSVDEQNADGAWAEVWYWYRRVIDDEIDVVWEKIRVDGVDEPNWLQLPYKSTQHNLGFCPVCWIQNMPVDNDIDGDPDCHGVLDLIHAVDALYAQANRGTLANCDPSLVIESDSEFDDIRKGSGAALQVEKGGKAVYLEITGAGIDRAMKLAEVLEHRVQIVARCQLEANQSGPARTVEEVEHNYSSMVEQADIYREQYGEVGVRTLLTMVLQAARQLGALKVSSTDGLPRIVRQQIKLPKRTVKDEQTGETRYEERAIGNGEQVELRWPAYFTPSQETVLKATQSAVFAKTGELIDDKHATESIAEYYQVENVPEMLAKIRAARVSSGAARPDASTGVASRTEVPRAGAAVRRLLRRPA
jgi:hypothetical protein